MQMSEDNIDGRHIINAYSPGRVTIDHVVYERSLIVSPQWLITDWRPLTLEEMEPGDLDPILDDKPEIVIIGTGDRQQFPSTRLLRRIAGTGIGCEFMDNAAACRTYTVLVSERRKVVAALLL